MTSDPAIRCDALQVWFGDARAVDGLSFQVARGSLFAFLGPNGAGKSTTLSVLCTLRRPSAGSAAARRWPASTWPLLPSRYADASACCSKIRAWTIA
jgi:ABC-type branched-subunit amino acid transport system ATPase component